jgi:TetR/AcrR family transcriptional repressor of nem operon
MLKAGAAARRRPARGTRAAKRVRDPEGTRAALLDATFARVHRNGFVATDLDTILRDAGVTKGALYHHFRGKDALGHALVEETLTELTRRKWLAPLEAAADPFAALIRVVARTSVRQEDVERGCPVNNLAQELSATDEGFRTRIAEVFALWRSAVERVLRDARAAGALRADVDPAEAALFFIAAYEGYISLAKSARDPGVLRAGRRQLVRWLESLRASTPGA